MDLEMLWLEMNLKEQLTGMNYFKLFQLDLVLVTPQIHVRIKKNIGDCNFLYKTKIHAFYMNFKI